MPRSSADNNSSSSQHREHALCAPLPQLPNVLVRFAGAVSKPSSSPVVMLASGEGSSLCHTGGGNEEEVFVLT